MNGNDEWADAAPLVTKLLADESYDCGLSGKLHLSAAQGRIEKRPDDGYRIFQWSHGVQNEWEEGHAWADCVYRYGIGVNHRQEGGIGQEAPRPGPMGLEQPEEAGPMGPGETGGANLGPASDRRPDCPPP